MDGWIIRLILQLPAGNLIIHFTIHKQNHKLCSTVLLWCPCAFYIWRGCWLNISMNCILVIWTACSFPKLFHHWPAISCKHIRLKCSQSVLDQPGYGSSYGHVLFVFYLRTLAYVNTWACVSHGNLINQLAVHSRIREVHVYLDIFKTGAGHPHQQELFFFFFLVLRKYLSPEMQILFSCCNYNNWIQPWLYPNKRGQIKNVTMTCIY